MAQSTKIMLVEDDNNLGEIYQARMAAEGYTVVVAHDGEEALALAAKEKPDLIISDVMMPKISGFEMLDILRNTPGLKDTKVIMLTALGQAEDKTRAQSLGADRYLVKSQVTLEDIVDNARALLDGGEAAAATAPQAAAPATTVSPVPVAAPPAADQPTVAPAPAADQPATVQTPALPAEPAAPDPAPIAVAAQPAPVDPAAAASAPVPSQTPEPALPPASVPTSENEIPTPAATTLAQPLSADPPSADAEAAVEAPTQQPFPQPEAPAAPPTGAAVPSPQHPVTAPAAADPAGSNEKVLAGAVDELLANTPQPAAQVPVVQAPVASTTEPVTNPEAQPTETAPAEQTDDKAPGDNTPVAHKKVIKPINDVITKPDLNSLLAAEEAKDITAPNPAVGGSNGSPGLVVPSPQTQPAIQPPDNHQPGNVFSPTADNAQPDESPTDPGSIAL